MVKNNIEYNYLYHFTYYKDYNKLWRSIVIDDYVIPLKFNGKRNVIYFDIQIIKYYRVKGLPSSKNLQNHVGKVDICIFLNGYVEYIKRNRKQNCFKIKKQF